MSRCIYEIYYKPWINNTEGKPWIYSGSDYYNNPDYLGSAASSSKPDWADGLTVSEWWKRETKNNPQDFEKHILIETSDDITRVELQSLESAIQTTEDHRDSDKYFNRTNKHWKTPLSNSPFKGMSYEEIYGVKRAKKIKENRSKCMKSVRENKSWNSNKNGKLTGLFAGKTYEEMYGEETAQRVKKIRSESTKELRKKDAHLLNKKALENGRHVSQQKIQCKHCDKKLDKANYSRWHGDKCKLNRGNS